MLAPIESMFVPQPEVALDSLIWTACVFGILILYHLTVKSDCAIQLAQQLGKEDLHPHDSSQSLHPLFAQMKLELSDIVQNFLSIPKRR